MMNVLLVLQRVIYYLTSSYYLRGYVKITKSNLVAEFRDAHSVVAFEGFFGKNEF